MSKLVFNVFSYTVDDGQDDPSNLNFQEIPEFKYTIHLFGRTDDGQSVALHVEDYQPTILLQLNNLSKMTIDKYMDIKNTLRRWIGFRNEEDKEPQYGDHLLDIDDPIVDRINIWGFQNGQKTKFFKFQFKSQFAYKRVLNVLKYKETQLGEQYILFDDIEPMLRFFHEKNLRTAGWVQVPKSKCIPRSPKLTRCNLEFTTSAKYVEQALDHDHICPKIVECAFDIEVFSHDETFPKPEIEENCVFQIGITLKNYQDKDFQKYLLHCGVKVKDIPDTKTFYFESEHELLMGFTKFIIDHDVDLIYSYNGDQFDWSYMFKRALFYKQNATRFRGFNYNKFCDMSRVKGFKCAIKANTFQSSAYGTNNYERIDNMPGRLPLDILIFIQRGFEQHESYKLDDIAEKKLGQRKDDVSPKDIFRFFASGNPEKVTKVGQYCVQDTALVQLLVSKMDIVTQLFEMANITFVPIAYLLSRGQQIKVFSQISKMTLEKGYSIPNVPQNPHDKFTGAIVLDPTPGLYTDPIAVLDFASLYPSCMISWNLDYSTIVLDPKYDNLPGIEYSDVEWTEEDGVYKKYRYAQNVPSIVPELVANLLASRKQVKKMIKELVKYETDANGKQIRIVTDPFRYSVLTGREQALKVSANSAYGFLGAQRMPLPAIASSVTACGRKMIMQAKFFMEHDFASVLQKRGITDVAKFQVIYGDTDSVFVAARGWNIEQVNKYLPMAEEYMNSHVFTRKSQAIEFEKTFVPFLILTKKRYAGQMYTPDDNVKSKLSYKGIALTRRNYCSFVKNVYKNILEAILNNRQDGVKLALKSLDSNLQIHSDGQFPMSDYIATVKLGASYANENLFQPKMVKRVKARNDEVPRPGERVSYVVLAPSPKCPDVSDRCELYSYAKANNLKLDLYYYLNNQLKNPIMDIFRVIGKQAEQDANKIFERYERRLHAKVVQAKTGMRAINSYYVKV